MNPIPQREELEARRDTLLKVLAEVRAEVAARQAELALTLAPLTTQRDDLKALVRTREAAFSEVESEAAQIDDE